MYICTCSFHTVTRKTRKSQTVWTKPTVIINMLLFLYTSEVKRVSRKSYSAIWVWVKVIEAVPLAPPNTGGIYHQPTLGQTRTSFVHWNICWKIVKLYLSILTKEHPSNKYSKTKRMGSRSLVQMMRQCPKAVKTLPRAQETEPRIAFLRRKGERWY